MHLGPSGWKWSSPCLTGFLTFQFNKIVLLLGTQERSFVVVYHLNNNKIYFNVPVGRFVPLNVPWTDSLSCSFQARSCWSWGRRTSRAGVKDSWAAARSASTPPTTSRWSLPDGPPSRITQPMVQLHSRCQDQSKDSFWLLTLKLVTEFIFSVVWATCFF